MSTRAGSATASLRAKQNLVRLLFSHRMTPTTTGTGTTVTGTAGTGRCTTTPKQATSTIPHHHHRQTNLPVDSSVYSHSDLRTAYLQAIHQYHPDKHYNQHCHNNNNNNNPSSFYPQQQQHQQQKSLFLQIQEAWKVYESMAKHSLQCSSSSSSSNWRNEKPTTTTMAVKHAHDDDGDMDANFTMFGVGCSFADTDQERHYRNYIMDQASRGYFTTGEIRCSTTITNNTDSSNHSTYSTTSGNSAMRKHSHPTRTTTTTDVKICPDDLFADTESFDTNVVRTSAASSSSSLVSHLIPPHRRPRPTTEYTK